jgi:hypothetical protein
MYQWHEYFLLFYVKFISKLNGKKFQFLSVFKKIIIKYLKIMNVSSPPPPLSFEYSQMKSQNLTV